LSTKDSRALCLDLFGKPSDEFIQMIIDKGIYASLHEAVNYRNDWTGMQELPAKRCGMIV